MLSDECGLGCSLVSQVFCKPSQSGCNTVRLIDSIVRIAPCLVSLNLEGTSRTRAAKSPNSGGLLSILLPQNWGLGGLSEPYWERLVQIDAELIPAPLDEALKVGTPCGLLTIDLGSRVRLRLNGTAVRAHNGGIELSLRQVYYNCPQYIQRRSIGTARSKPQSAVTVTATALTSRQIEWISRVDTFFISSFHSESDCADTSHRGGFPGFVRVLNSNTLIFPDYAGHNMFNTLGNIVIPIKNETISIAQI